MRDQPGQERSQNQFTNAFRKLNGYTEIELREWLFVAGMKFGDIAKWWKTGDTRTKAHEGLDLLFFLDGRGERHLLPPGTAIPPLLRGIVVTRIPDFMGESIILAHDRWDGAGRKLHSLYAHLQPAIKSVAGKTISAGSEIGTIAAPRVPLPACPPHLHISLAWVDEAYPIKAFRWGDFCASESFRPDDPLVLIRQT